ncbi:MAG: hypothetical protein CSMARM5_0031 [Candidatus Parvarchaeum acidophilus ARMAN-5_'5-way FS']|jgi:hypothetical protein|uniref:Uncharacterized protein n=2 Tax=Parvarchaeum acidophilus TaxID=662761 RepID=D6GWP2_PARA5|nr:MAG: hypothetical protein BJBARM5_0911 [Candidatus Parvarchaeum acidophilus ARMAN-5]EGD71926.1 MAG: hypothetical protein CSMARM5_0031 [Candidatus Parvarchaeum acidophilus ARMAN-5_'5-way FS']
MIKAGIAESDGRLIVAVIINKSVQVHRVKTLNEAKDILNTAKPEVVGVDKSAAEFFDDISFSFNGIKVDGSIPDSEEIKSLTMLSITKDSDKKAINSAYYA